MYSVNYIGYSMQRLHDTHRKGHCTNSMKCHMSAEHLQLAQLCPVIAVIVRKHHHRQRSSDALL